AAVRTLAGPQLPVLGVAGEHLDDVVDAPADAAGEVARLEARQDRILDDQLADRVGERAFQAIADLDADLAIIRRDNQQDAAVLLLLPDAPVAAELIAIVLDRGALQRLQCHDHQLAGGLALELGELAVELG